MPVPSDLVGASTEPLTRPVDARWLMAYAAGVGDGAPCYLDTRRPGGIVGHPVFPVCLEWDPVLAAGALASPDVLRRDEVVRGVHATHDLQIHRLVRPDDVLTTTATVTGVERRRPGAYQTIRLDTTDVDGDLVATTVMGSLFLGVEVDGPDRPDDAVRSTAPPSTATKPTWTRSRRVTATAAHVYTECSRIWNPIHTDPAVAAAAGLPGLILHGTATLAMAITEVVERCAAGDPSRVSRISARFGAMVLMPSAITIEVVGGASDGEREDVIGVGFAVRNEAGALAISHGRVTLAG
jgi:acyl dehydratase